MNLYVQLVDIIGTPPVGFEWCVWLICCFIFIVTYHFLVLMLQYLMKFVGGIR